MTPTDHAELYNDELSLGIDYLRSAGFKSADGNVESISGDPDPSYTGFASLSIKLTGYSPLQDLAVRLAVALVAVWGADNAPLLLEQVIREHRHEGRKGRAA